MGRFRRVFLGCLLFPSIDCAAVVPPESGVILRRSLCTYSCLGPCFKLRSPVMFAPPAAISSLVKIVCRTGRFLLVRRAELGFTGMLGCNVRWPYCCSPILASVPF